MAVIVSMWPGIGFATGPKRSFERNEGTQGGGLITLEDNGGSVKMTLDIGGIPRGAATPADCGLIAEGKISGSSFFGAVTRQGVLQDLFPDGDPAEASLPPLKAIVEQKEIRLAGGAALASRFCGGSGFTFDGVFERKK